eukprot:8164-Heterococcus_DN1.PRE.9
MEGLSIQDKTGNGVESTHSSTALAREVPERVFAYSRSASRFYDRQDNPVSAAIIYRQPLSVIFYLG